MTQIKPSREDRTPRSTEDVHELMDRVIADPSPIYAGCAGYIPMAGFGETRCKRCGIPLDRHPVRAQ